MGLAWSHYQMHTCLSLTVRISSRGGNQDDAVLVEQPDGTDHRLRGFLMRINNLDMRARIHLGVFGRHGSWAVMWVSDVAWQGICTA